jgi:redox-regulated HSP33 family molecular chaperone
MELEEFKKEIESKFQKSSMKSYTFDRQKIHSKKLNQSFVKKPLQMSEYHTDVPLEKVKSIKAMFQNFVKQSFDVKSKAHQNILVTSDEKIEPDFNSFTQLTFDSSHPNYASNYVGMKKGN